jgi:transcriptional regulator with XRE-family HTH domain
VATKAQGAAHGTTTGQRAPATLRQYFRRRDSLSQHAIAKRLGCSQGYVSMVVRGERAFRGKGAVKVAELTGVPLEKLIVVARKKKQKKRQGELPLSLPENSEGAPVAEPVEQVGDEEMNTDDDGDDDGRSR